jgi:hypothetical protein
MALPDVKPYALAYLNQWHEFDRDYRNALQADAQAEKLRKLAATYVVAWNFKAGGKHMTPRLWQDVARAVGEVDIDDTKQVAEKVGKLALTLGEIVASYSGGAKSAPVLLSAASKFLWFRGYDAVRIYDKNAVQALNGMLKNDAQENGRKKWRLDGDYGAYLVAWEDAYRQKEDEIKQASAGLATLLEWSHVQDRAAALAATGQSWFHERVFDRLLWAYKPAAEAQ